MAGKRKPTKRVPKKRGHGVGLKEIMTRALASRCDPEVYLYLTNVYSAAASRKMPSKAGAFRPPDEPGRWLVLSDIPINRGMLAVVGELRSMNIKDELMHAYMMRVMDFSQVFEHREKFAEFIRDSDEPGAVSVSEALIKACAAANYLIAGEHMQFDLDDVLRRARMLTEAEEQAEISATTQSTDPSLPAPLVPSDVDLRGEPVPWDAFIDLAMKQFGVSRKEATELVEETKRWASEKEKERSRRGH
jgi:hypothetical protein